MHFLTLRKPAGYDYLVEDLLDRPGCPQCGSTELYLEEDGDILCEDCLCEFEFLEDPISQIANGLLYYDKGKDYQDSGKYTIANHYYNQALECFAPGLNEKPPADLWLICALIYQFKIEQNFDLELLNHLENYLKAIREFVRLHGLDSKACFLQGRAYQIYADHQDYRAIEYYEKALERMEESIRLAETEENKRGSELEEEQKRSWKDFVQTFVQQISSSLAIAYQKKEEENPEYKEKARKLYLKLADVIEEGIVFPQKDQNDQILYEKPSLDPELGSMGEDLKRALSKAGQKERMARLYPKILELSAIALMGQKSARNAFVAARSHLQAADYYGEIGDEPRRLSAMLKLQQLYAQGAFDGFDFLDRHFQLPYALNLNSQLADVYESRKDLAGAENYLKTNINYLRLLQSEYLENDAFFEEEDRFFNLLEALLALACFYQRQSLSDMALEAFEDFFEDYEEFVDNFSGSIHLDMSGYAPDDNLLEEMIEGLEKLQVSQDNLDSLERLQKQARALYEELFK